MFEEDQMEAETYVRVQPFDGNHFNIRLANPDTRQIFLIASGSTKTDILEKRVFQEIPEMRKHNIRERVFYEVEEKC
jgi:hypothetical protein